MFLANFSARVPARQVPPVRFYTPPMPALITLRASILQRYEIGTVSKSSSHGVLSEAIGS